MKSEVAQTLFSVVGLSVLATLVRVAIAARGGLWRDEALFLFVAQSSSWTAMIDFLRFHESQPPLFYAIMRPWLSVIGESDTIALIPPVLIGTAMIPAIYFAGASLFSKRVALIAATLATFSPALAQNSGAVRPYSLLPLLALGSVFTLIRAIDTGKSRMWAGYVVCTVGLLFTHNWAWLIFGGEWIAFIVVLFLNAGGPRKKVLREWLVVQAAIALAYLPWLRSLLFQTQHTGHPAVVLDSVVDIFLLVFVGIRGLLQATVLGYPVGRADSLWTNAQRWLTTIPLILLGASEFLRIRELRSVAPANTASFAEPHRRKAVVFSLLLITPLSAWAAAMVLSMRTDVLVARCLAALAPLLILGLAYWLGLPRDRIAKLLAQLGFTALVATYLVTVYALSLTTRSNARELTAAVASRIQPSDLVIVAPEWLASSFNRYFTPQVEQIDYPHFGREGTVDFADVHRRFADPIAFARLESAIVAARQSGRRVWLIMETRDVKAVTSYDIARAPAREGWQDAGMIRANQIRNELTKLFGSPDTSVVGGARLTQFEKLRAYLFEPQLGLAP